MAGAATVEKALDVLFHLHEAGGARGLTEIGRALDLPKSSCHRLLTTLVDREIVDRDEAGRYRPGLALLSLGIGAQRREPVVAAARPELEAEAARFGETVFLVGLRHARLRVLDRVEGPGFLRAAPGIGEVVPFRVTAAGKLYAVLGADAVGEAQEARGLERADPVAADRSVALEPGERSAIRARGYALNRDAWIEGLSVLAVPIWQSTGERRRELTAVLALAAASPRFDRLGETEVAERLLTAAGRATARLDGTGSPRRAAGPRANTTRGRTA